MADPASSSDGAPPSPKPSPVSITVDFAPPSKPGTPAAPREPLVWEPPEARELGKVLPGYEVLELIGSGGMGAVYRARQKSLERLVAVKVLSPELARRAPEFTERFNSEASALARLSHPSIVHLFDCGRTQDGQLFIAMELVEGRDVAERLGGKQPLPVDEALSITITVCEALAHAHQRGVIHRDIKPANVMIDPAGRVKITDFGLARILQGAVPKGKQTTSLLGTPRFTAPEALVPGAEVDARADVFSTGVMLYQMLTGEVPRGAFSPPSELVPGLDRKLDDIVAKAMAESPDERYANAEELRKAIEEIRNAPVIEDLPAATAVNLTKSALPQRQAPSPASRAASAPDDAEFHDGHEDDHHEFEAQAPPPSASLMPWVFTLGVLAIGGFWAWQQWKHPDKGMLTGDNTVIRTGTEPPKPAPVTPVDPVATVPAVTQPPVTPPAPQPVTPPTTPAPATPATAPPTAEALAEVQRRISQIQGDFSTSTKEWQASQDSKFAQLDVQYLRAVKSGIVSMRNARRLQDLTGLEEEERLLTNKTPLPPVDSSKQPERARLRGIYDAQVLQIARAGAESKVEIYNRYLGSLFAYQSILKQTGKNAAAEVVAGVMDQAVKERDALRATLASPR